MKKSIALIGLFITLNFYGCSSESPTLSQEYSIISDETKPNNAKRVIEIELPNALPEEKVEEIADSIKNSTDKNVKNVFVIFKIKDSSASGYWAMIQYTPEKSVNFLGNTLNEQQSLEEQIDKYSPKGKVLGVWEFKWGVDCAIGIHELNTKTFSNFICDTGVSNDNPLKSIQIKEGTRFENLEDNENGEYMLINKDGDLEFKNKTDKTYYLGKKIKE